MYKNVTGVNTKSNIRVASLNVNGISDGKKRKQVFTWFKQQEYNIIFMQETHSCTKTEKHFEEDWGSKVVLNSHSSNSAGVAILFASNFNATVINIWKDCQGRKLLINIEVDGEKFTLINVYGPNKDDGIFFSDIAKLIDEYCEGSLILGGDFNTVLNLSLDKIGGRPRTNFKARDEILTLNENYNLIDIWRHKNPNTKRFTWRSNTKPVIMTRLDFFLVTYNLVSRIESVNIHASFKSDHSLISLKIKRSVEERGPGLWKFNSSFLSNPQYVDKIKECIDTTVKENQNLNPSLLWEMIKFNVRSASIRFAIENKKKEKLHESKLNLEISKLEEEYDKSQSDEMFTQLNVKKQELEQLIAVKTKGAIIRSRARWVEEGEKNTKYFLNLEKRNYVNKTISCLNVDDELVENPKEIREKIKQFYEVLYGTELHDINENNECFFAQNTDRLSETEGLSCEGLLNEEECTTVLKSFVNNKTPGTDGLTADFYKFFWLDVKKYFIEAFNYAFQNGLMSISQRRGVITLLPKNKDPLLIKNWRPITLLNTDYKLASKTIACRIKEVLPSVINSDQTGFLKGRYIGENIRKTIDIIEYAEIHKCSGMIFSIDFEKAFDKLEWDFVDKVLKHFGFKENLCKWVKLFYTDIESCIVNNGYTSNYFKVSRGVRQGDPLSPYLFILAAEILSVAIRNEDSIKGFNINGIETKISQYADDTLIFLDGSKRSLLKVIDILDKFKKCSGLCINYDKSEVIKLGILKATQDDFEIPKKLKWNVSNFKSLGIMFSLDLTEMVHINYNEKLKQIQNCLKVWSMRNISIQGKILLIKTLALPKLTYVSTVLPNPSKEFIKKVENELFGFVWKKKPDKIKRTILYNTFENGGLKMVDYESFCHALKISWIKRLKDDNNHGFWKKNTLIELEKFGGNHVWQSNFDKKWINSQNVPFFLRNILEAWYHYSFSEPDSAMACANQSLWNNSYIKIGNKEVMYKQWFRKGVKWINDLLSEEKDGFLSFQDFKAKYGINCNILTFFGLIRAIPKRWIRLIFENKEFLLNGSYNSNDSVFQAKRIVKATYDIIIKKKCERPENTMKKWENDIVVNDEMWPYFFTIGLKSALDIPTRSFQYLFIHRRVPTNKFVHRIGLIESPDCTFCKENVESLVHLFYECEYVSRFWVHIEILLNAIYGQEIKLTKFVILFGYNVFDPDPFVNYIILLGKQYIYKRKCLNSKPIFQAFKGIVDFMFQVENYIATGKGKLDNHNKKWGLYMRWKERN